MSKATATIVARVRKIALALPGTTEKESHGTPSWFRKRMFCTVDDHHHGAPHLALWLRAEPGAQHAFVDSAPEHFFVPPYVGSSGWLGVRLDSGLGWAVIANLIEQGWREAAPSSKKRPR